MNTKDTHTVSQPFKVEPRHWMLMAALAIAAYASYRLIEPYVGSIILAFLISLLYYPAHERIARVFGDRPNTSAIVSCLVLTIIIVIPLLVVLSSIVAQGTTFSKESYAWISSGGNDCLTTWLSSIKHQCQNFR